MASCQTIGVIVCYDLYKAKTSLKVTTIHFKHKLMKLKKLFFTGLLIAAFTSAINAQQYNTSFGVRLGYDSGLTLKHFFAPASAGEFILSASPRYFQLTGLYEYQQPVPEHPTSTGMWASAHTSAGYITTKIIMTALSYLAPI